jgi:hypothetical protein
VIVPEGVDVDQPIDIDRSVTGDRTMVSITMGGATIIIETDPESAVNLPLLIQGLPNILDRLYQEES